MATQRRKSTKRPKVRPPSKISQYKDYEGVTEKLAKEPKEKAALILLGLLHLGGMTMEDL